MSLIRPLAKDLKLLTLYYIYFSIKLWSEELVKNEMFYERSWAGVTIDEFIEKLDQYIHWYAEKRRKLSLGGLSPIECRKSLGLIPA